MTIAVPISTKIGWGRHTYVTTNKTDLRHSIINELLLNQFMLTLHIPHKTANVFVGIFFAIHRGELATFSGEVLGKKRVDDTKKEVEPVKGIRLFRSRLLFRDHLHEE